jgi:hypothetical protein
MLKMKSILPIACCLTTAELRERAASLHAQFRSAVIEIEELPDGYVFRIPGDRKYVAAACELIMAERECCPFFTFELTAQPDRGPVNIRVTGPEGTKDFLKTMLRNSDVAF